MYCIYIYLCTCIYLLHTWELLPSTFRWYIYMYIYIQICMHRNINTYVPIHEWFRVTYPVTDKKLVRDPGNCPKNGLQVPKFQESGSWRNLLILPLDTHKFQFICHLSNGSYPPPLLAIRSITQAAGLAFVVFTLPGEQWHQGGGSFLFFYHGYFVIPGPFPKKNSTEKHGCFIGRKDALHLLLPKFGLHNPVSH